MAVEGTDTGPGWSGVGAAAPEPVRVRHSDAIRGELGTGGEATGREVTRGDPNSNRPDAKAEPTGLYSGVPYFLVPGLELGGC